MQPDKKLIEQTLQEVVDKFLIPRFMMLGMNATGKWLKSLEVEVDGERGLIKGEKYTEQLVFGRKPNENQNPDNMRRWAYGMAFYNPEFKNWLNARGLTEYGVQIAYKIANKGTSWHKKGGSNLLEVLEEPTTIKFIYDKIGAWYKIQIANELRRYAKQKLEVA